MVVIHFVENLSGQVGTHGGPFGSTTGHWWLPTGFAAPTFIFLSGMSYRLWASGAARRGHSERNVSMVTIRRGLFLIALGFAFNVLIWLPEDVFNWDVLTLIGCGLLMLNVARQMPDAVVVFTAGLVIAVAPALRVAAEYSSYWTAGYYDYDFTWTDVIMGWLVTGYFPIFPWLAFPLLGYAFAPRLLGHGRGLVPIGTGFVLASVAVIASWTSLPVAVTGGGDRAWSMFPASTAYVLGTLGGVCLAVTVLHRLLDRDGDRGGWLATWVTPLSRHSLSLYLLHHAVHLWPLWIYGAATTEAATSLWQKAMPAAASMSLAIGFLVLAAMLCREADRRRIPMAESLMRRLCG
jgi:uncharacterized membrane protein